MNDIAASHDPVLLYDGDCGLCNRVVRLLLSLDGEGVLHFAPLQGRAGQEFLRLRGMPLADHETAIFVRSWNSRATEPVLMRTDAALAALASCGGNPRRVASVLRLIPRWIRDLGYRAVAATRYRVFGPWKDRPLKKEVWRLRFLS